MGRTELVDDRCDIAKEVSAEFQEPKIDMENDRVGFQLTRSYSFTM